MYAFDTFTIQVFICFSFIFKFSTHLFARISYAMVSDDGKREEGEEDEEKQQILRRTHTLALIPSH